MFVRIENFQIAQLMVNLLFATTTNWGEWLEIKEKLALEIKEIVEKNGAGFAFPSQSIYIEKLKDCSQRVSGYSIHYFENTVF